MAFLESVNLIIDKISFWIPIFTVLSALYALHKGHSQIKAIKDVKQSLSTRYLGKFPDFIPDITNLIGDAKRTITIACDFPGYGMFSAPRRFKLYLQAIESRLIHNQCNIIMIHLGTSLRRRTLDEQFPTEERDWNEWKKNNENNNNLVKFIRYYPWPSSTIGSINLKDFKGLKEIKAIIKLINIKDFKHVLEKEEIKLLERFYNYPNAILCLTKVHMAIHFWIIDDKEAIFSIPTYEEGSEEVGFKTSDRSLIDALKGIGWRYQKTCEKEVH
jgi:hypothetical protein